MTIRRNYLKIAKISFEIFPSLGTTWHSSILCSLTWYELVWAKSENFKVVHHSYSWSHRNSLFGNLKSIGNQQQQRRQTTRKWGIFFCSGLYYSFIVVCTHRLIESAYRMNDVKIKVCGQMDRYTSFTWHTYSSLAVHTFVTQFHPHIAENWLNRQNMLQALVTLLSLTATVAFSPVGYSGLTRMHSKTTTAIDMALKDGEKVLVIGVAADSGCGKSTFR